MRRFEVVQKFKPAHNYDLLARIEGDVRLKRIELKGFKSFCDRTEIHFNRNITGIVGPNGCGKSNIVDAIRWVMGEQSAKHLRGKNMEDVIFAGSKDREPSSLSYVELTFSTQGAQTPPQYANFEEVSIGRKLYRDGTSEYTINKQAVRLKDVTDFFLGTGIGAKAYSIIEQGRVGQIVTAKPEERRHFIEEAAGISKFQMRKQLAERRMEATQQNLLRLVDIVSEIERQKASLERQAKKAEKFKIIRDELKELDLKSASWDYEKLSTRQKNHLEKLKEFDHALTETETRVARDELACEEARLTLTQIETQVADLQQKVYECDNLFQLTENELKNRRDGVARLQAQHQQGEASLKSAHDQYADITAQIATVVANAVWAECEAQSLSAQTEDAQSYYQELQNQTQILFDTIENARASQNTSERRLVEITTTLQSLATRLQDKTAQKENAEAEAGELSAKIGKLKRLLDATHKDLAGIKQMKLSLSEQSEKLASEFSLVEGQVKAEQSALEAIKEKLLQKKSRLQSLEELERNFEGYLEGPRSLLEKKRQGEMDAILGSVADFLETDAEYMNAVSAVLGEKAQVLVVGTPGEGVACAESLRSLATGRSSFVSLGNLSLADDLPRVRELISQKPEAGVRGIVADFVRLKPGYESLGNVLFHDTVLVDTLTQALDFWQTHKTPVATLTGEIISREGILSGGSPEKASSALLEKKQEIKTLKDVVQDLMTTVKEKEETCLDLQRKLKTLKADLESMQSSSHEEEIKITRQEKDVLHCQQELEALEVTRQKLLTDLQQMESDIADWQTQIARLTAEELSQTQILAEATALLTARQADEERAKIELAQKQHELTDVKVRLAEKRQEKLALDREVERLFSEKSRLSDVVIETESQLELVTKSILFWESRVQVSDKHLSKIWEAKTRVEADYRTLKDQFEAAHQSVRDQEAHLHGLHRDYSRLKDEINRETLALSEVRNHLSRLNEQTLERYQVALSDVYAEILQSLPEGGFDYAEAVGRAQGLREEFQKAGNVNLAAIDELKEVSERHDFLAAQKKDLEHSLSSLEEAIHKINETTKTRFEETFHLVNQKFQQVFPKLFRGGEARLQLTDPDNILATGVDIVAQPPGKRLQSISLLSGGEKALTAVSMLFAIFLIKPSPFCLLDEVDAPLDDVNVDRYNEIVKDMAQSTQFIVVTHNKRTMQIADGLYGVTMEQAGVSQMVSVDLG